jgi:hypothetical protein
MIRLIDAKFCINCEGIYDIREVDRGVHVCPGCASQYTFDLTKFLNRKETGTTLPKGKKVK